MHSNETHLDGFPQKSIDSKERQWFVTARLRPMFQELIDRQLEESEDDASLQFSAYEEYGEDAVIYRFNTYWGQHTEQLYYAVSCEMPTRDQQLIVKTTYTVGDIDHVMTKQRSYSNPCIKNGGVYKGTFDFGVAQETPILDYSNLSEREKDVLFELGEDISEVDRDDYRLASALLQKITHEAQLS